MLLQEDLATGFRRDSDCIGEFDVCLGDTDYGVFTLHESREVVLIVAFEHFVVSELLLDPENIGGTKIPESDLASFAEKPMKVSTLLLRKELPVREPEASKSLYVFHFPSLSNQSRISTTVVEVQTSRTGCSYRNGLPISGGSITLTSSLAMGSKYLLPVISPTIGISLSRVSVLPSRI
jgi:hypothetical protein